MATPETVYLKYKAKLTRPGRDLTRQRMVDDPDFIEHHQAIYGLARREDDPDDAAIRVAVKRVIKRLELNASSNTRTLAIWGRF
jgi:hypothetical protein